MSHLGACGNPIFERGLLTLHPAVRTLRALLPDTFEGLGRSFGAAVVDASGRHVLLESGTLAEAVAASACVPVLFARMAVPGAQQRVAHPAAPVWGCGMGC